MPIISGEDNKMVSSSLVGVLKQGENHHYFLGGHYVSDTLQPFTIR